MSVYENFMKSLELTISQPRNQWAEQISAQANQEPVSEKFWNEPPKQVTDYEWPENAI